jgi:hypothetical protein
MLRRNPAWLQRDAVLPGIKLISRTGHDRGAIRFIAAAAARTADLLPELIHSE